MNMIIFNWKITNNSPFVSYFFSFYCFIFVLFLQWGQSSVEDLFTTDHTLNQAPTQPSDIPCTFLVIVNMNLKNKTKKVFSLKMFVLPRGNLTDIYGD